MDDLERARDAIAKAERVVAVTGAGISAESGIPTFRGVNGYWRTHRVEELASPEGFAADPARVWEWYEERRGAVLAARPNAAHVALARLEHARGHASAVITQNVDGLHATAGVRNLIEVHGSIFTIRCTGCGASRDDRTHPLATRPPRCATCGELERPGVVWFGEMLPRLELDRAVAELRECDVCLVVGTSAVVQPAGSFFMVAKSAGALTVEVNVEPTERSEDFDVVLRGRAGDVLPRLVEGIA